VKDRSPPTTLAALPDGPRAFTTPSREGSREDLEAAPQALRVAYAVLGALVVAYAVSVIVRHGDTASRWVDGFGVGLLELVTSALCLLRAVLGRAQRATTIAFGSALLAWSLGDLIVALCWQPSGGAPAAADVSYLIFYPLAFVAIVLLMRAEVVRLAAASWLDGVVAGLGAAAVCAAFAFRGVLGGAGDGLTRAMNLAYPIGDLLLFALVVAGTAVLADKNRGRFMLVALACSVNAIGDTFNALPSSAFGATCDALAWPVAILLVSISVWMRPAPAVAPDPEAQAGFVLPGLAAAAGIVILLVGGLHPVGQVALGLAAATLCAAGLRLLRSVGALRALTAERHRESMTDDLTGLGNRRLLSHLLGAFFAEGQRPGRSLALLFVDLDRFKEINDAFGHVAGDEVLRQIGPRLEGSLRPGDVLVRLGGDEFAVLLRDARAGFAMTLAEHLTSSLDEPFWLGVLPVRVSASIGIAVAPDDAKEVGVLLGCADAAMYRAKTSRASWAVYDSRLDDGGDPLRRAKELGAGLEEGQLRLHFQPQLDLRRSEVVTVEALVRWEHPRLGTIAPTEFLSLAEDAGLMPALTSWVLDHAIAQCARWRAGGHDLAISVNVSSSNLLDAGFTELVVETLRRHDFPPKSLILEITETCIISDYDRSRSVIDGLHRLGVTTSIDDFGAGFTSLAYLAGLAVGELKLDRTFVAGLRSRDAVREIELVRYTIGLGHALGLRVVAEGIEDQATLDLLGELGCDLAQGHLIGRPVAGDALRLGSLWPMTA
jgi:diguanylate cyclase (GGDEF)-like protein